MARKYNFNPGPSTLPAPALEKAREALLDYEGLGYGIMEISHRHKGFEAVNDAAMALLRELLGVPEGYEVLFVGGGASTQFFHVPMNFLGDGKVASYINTGTWSKKAIKEAKKFGEVAVAGTTEEENFTRIPRPDEIHIAPASVYVHVTSNNTIFGTQWAAFPDTGTIPMICDMSSDILARKVDVSKFGMIYAGAQKNLGPSGVTVVIIRKDLLEMCSDSVPTMVNYQTHAAKKSLFNTPPVFAIFVMKLVLEHVKERGGLAAMEKQNDAKAALVYGLFDENSDFFRGTVTDKGSRSKMNATVRFPSEDLEKKFIADADAAGFIGLKGHRSVGGIRISMYNAMPLEGIEKLMAFMRDFAKNNG
ncbi:MAG: 3-phosphoserine/phosphohydroxythreonine transaminase [Planctomycetota bacterium]|jgi:phosphoserine aminotransferase